MNLEEKLKKVRRDYVLTKPTEGLLNSGFYEIWEKIVREEEKKFVFQPLFAKSLVIAGFVFFIFGGAFFGLIQAAQGVLPGEPLYPLKRFSEDLVLTVSGDGEERLNRRAEELRGLSEKGGNPELFEKTLKEYEEAVLDSKEEAEKKGESRDFRQILENQEKEFKETIHDNPSSKNELEKAIETSRRGRGNGEVKGVLEKDRSRKDKENKNEGKENNGNTKDRGKD